MLAMSHHATFVAAIQLDQPTVAANAWDLCTVQLKNIGKRGLSYCLVASAVKLFVQGESMCWAAAVVPTQQYLKEPTVATDQPAWCHASSRLQVCKIDLD